jgi:hypothetical protein
VAGRGIQQPAAEAATTDYQREGGVSEAPEWQQVADGESRAADAESGTETQRGWSVSEKPRCAEWRHVARW